MSVYVDKLHNAITSKKWKYRQACHMVADTENELHEFAENIGLKRGWFQSKSSIPHYDLTGNKRQKAISRGAKEINSKELARFSKRKKE